MLRLRLPDVFAPLAVFAALCCAASAQLKPGDNLPALPAQTLSGKPIELPAADSGKPRVLVFSFAKSASGDSRQWSEHLDKETEPNRPPVYRIIVLESVPRLIRGMAVAGIKSGMPKPEWDNTVLLYNDEAAWKSRLGVTGDNHAYAVLIDGGGAVRWIGSTAFTDAEYAQLQAALAHIKPAE